MRADGRYGELSLTAKSGRTSTRHKSWWSSVLEGAGYQLRAQIDSEKARAGVDCFVASHAGLWFSWSVDIPFGSGQDARMKRNFRQLR